MREDIEELEGLLKAPEAPVEAPVEGNGKAPEVTTEESVEYYLGKNGNKLPLTAEVMIDGKKAPLSTILNHYRQRSELDKKYAELKGQRQEWEKERGDIEKWKTLYNEYGQMDQWVREHPQEWNKLQEVWKNKDSILLAGGATSQQAAQGASQQTAQAFNLDPNHPIIQKLVEQEKKISELSNFKTQFETHQQQMQMQADLKEVEGEVETFRKEFPEINLDEKDGEGISLAYKIMVHGIDKKIPNFKLAAFDMFGPKLLEIAQMRGRTEAVKGIQKDRQQGVVSRSSTPPVGQSAKVNPKARWGDLSNAAAAELEKMLQT